MILENCKEMWTETPRLASGKSGKPINRDRFSEWSSQTLPGCTCC